MEDLKNATPTSSIAPGTVQDADSQESEKTYYKTIAQFVLDSKVAMINAQDPEIQPLLEKRGYVKADFTGTLTKLDALDDLNEKQKKEYGEKYEATEAYNKAVSVLHDPYIDHLIFARRLFKKNIAAQTAMDLTGKRKQSESGYAQQASIFYKNALGNPAYIAAFAKKGVDKTELESQRKGYNDLVSLAAKKKKETSEAQAATATRDELYDVLHE